MDASLSELREDLEGLATYGACMIASDPEAPDFWQWHKTGIWLWKGTH